MAKKKIKNTTIDKLAGMVQRGFLNVDKKFDEVDEKFIHLEYEVNARFDRLEKIILHEHRERIERLEDQVKELQSDFRQLVGFRK